MQLFDHEENERSTHKLKKEFSEIRGDYESVRLRDLVDYYCTDGAGDHMALLGAIDAKGICSIEAQDLNQRITKLLCLN